MSSLPPVPLSGLKVVLSPTLRDGTVIATPFDLIVGTRPWSAIEEAGERGRRIARNGLANELAWLGEPVGPAVDDPYPPIGGRALVDRMRRFGS